MTLDILVTGGKGMVGKAVESFIPNAMFVGSRDYDLRSPSATEKMFTDLKPKYIIHLAAKVGGVKGNKTYVADFFTDNILINTNLLKFAHKYHVQRVVSMLSTCVYPDDIPYPLKETNLHVGEPHPSNYGYAYAKRMLEVQSRVYNEQYGTDFLCAIPNNIYGAHDNFDLENGHVIPAIIRKVWEAKNNRTNVHLWGDGSPLREFTHSSDIARALLYLLWNAPKQHPAVNIGLTKEYPVKYAAETIAAILDFRGEIIWDTSKPAGQHRKPSDNSVFTTRMNFDVDSYLSLENGLVATCAWFKDNYPYVRGCQ